MRRRLVVWACVLVLPAAALAQHARRRVPWMDLPSTWTVTVKSGIVTAVPPDLGPGESLALMIEPETRSRVSLAADYRKALKDIGGPWTPIGKPVVQPRDGGWTFQLGVGTVLLGGTRYIGQTTVARHGKRRVRSWILASSGAVFNRYKTTTATAIASVQDLTLKGHHGASASGGARGAERVASGKVYVGHVPPGFGRGVSGVYIGLERGLHAHAGYGIGSPSLSADVEYEIDVFYPNGRYRRRFPDRGLASDPSWERAHGAAMWGTWTRHGGRIVVRRGSYTTTYRIKNERTLVSEGDREWKKMRLKPGTRIDGVYASSHWLSADGPRLVLHADGTYEDRRGFLHAFAGPESLVVPDGPSMIRRMSDAQLKRAMGGGRGTYTYADFTLTLRDQNGRVWQVGLGVPPGEKLPSPRWLYMDQSRLIRQ